VESVKGSFLIASPALADPNFNRTVVLITEHTSDGAFGLVVNRPAKQTVADLWQILTEEPCESLANAYSGGPVQPGALFVLHGCAELADDDPVIPGLYLGGDVGLLRRLLEREREEEVPKGEFFRVFCGYAGWGEGQLDGELKSGGWLVQKASPELVFSTPPESCWQKTMARQGGAYEFFSLMPPDPELN